MLLQIRQVLVNNDEKKFAIQRNDKDEYARLPPRSRERLAVTLRNVDLLAATQVQLPELDYPTKIASLSHLTAGEHCSACCTDRVLMQRCMNGTVGVMVRRLVLTVLFASAVLLLAIHAISSSCAYGRIEVIMFYAHAYILSRRLQYLTFVDMPYLVCCLAPSRKAYAEKS